MSGRDFGAVEALLAGAVGRVFPSAELCVVDENAEVLHSFVGEPHALFDLASLTKALVTTTLAMRLIDSRKLSLDDEPRPGVSVRLLLAHASGLPAWKPLHEMTAGAPDPRRAIIDLCRTIPLERPPASRSVYSDLGFILLGDAIERASGLRLDEAWSQVAKSVHQSVNGSVNQSINLSIDQSIDQSIDRSVSKLLTFHPDPAACAPTENGLRGVVHDDNARAMGGVAGHAGLFGNARAVSSVVAALVRAAWVPGKRRDRTTIAVPETVRRFWHPSGIAESTWCLGWDRPASQGVSSAGTRWPRDGVGHLGFTGCSIWIDPPRGRWVILLSNRVHPTRDNQAIKAFRPALHDAIVAALDGPG